MILYLQWILFDAKDIDNELRKTTHADDMTKQLAYTHKIAKDIVPYIYIQALMSKQNPASSPF